MITVMGSRRVWSCWKDATLNHPTANLCGRWKMQVPWLMRSQDAISLYSIPLIEGKLVQTFWRVLWQYGFF